MSRHAITGLFIALALITLALAGCGGSGGAFVPPGGGPGPAGTSRVSGRVVEANQTGTGISQAVVTETSTGASVTTDDNGNFTLTGLPAGTVTLTATSPRVAGFEDASIPSVPTTPAGANPPVLTIAMLPDSAGQIVQVALNPMNPSVDIGGAIHFTATPVNPTGTVSAAPTWVLSSPIGTISPAGNFSATAVGVATLTAVAGRVAQSTTVTVTALTVPRISSVILSTDTLPSSGGNIVITAAASYGAGVTSLAANIFGPHGGAPAATALTLVAGDSRDGTYRAIYAAPPNDNVPDGTGHQEPEAYDVQIVATYGAGNTVVSGFTRFNVLGLDQPVPPPTG